jgi:hypothetical protein
MPLEISKLFQKSEKRMEIIYAHREQKQMQTIFEELMRYRDDDGRLQCEWFIKLPTEEVIALNRLINMRNK